MTLRSEVRVTFPSQKQTPEERKRLACPSLNLAGVSLALRRPCLLAIVRQWWHVELEYLVVMELVDGHQVEGSEMAEESW